MPENVYRVMIEDPGDPSRPLIGETHLTLGPRVPWDVVPDSSNYISTNDPDGKPQGIAVFPTPQAAAAAINPDVGDQYPTWQIDVKAFAAYQLTVLPRNGLPQDDSELVLATLATVSWPEYWYHIAQTQALWQKVDSVAVRPVPAPKGSQPGGDPGPTAPPKSGDDDMKKTRSRSGGPNDCVRSPSDEQVGGAILRHWTPEREADARPRPMEEANDPDTIEAMEAVLEEHRGQLRADPATSKVTNITQIPFAAVGRLNFDWDGKPYHGSAWIINTEPQGIITAAHNVYIYDPSASEKPAWAENVVFKLQYDDRAYAAQWEIEQSIVLQGWFGSNAPGKTKDFARDFAVLVPKLKVEGQPALHVQIDQTAQNYMALGYPGEPIEGFDFQGKFMWQSAGDRISETGGLVSAYNNMTAGSSGGPWCARREDAWVANGLQSHRGSSKNVAVSPYLTVETFGALLACGALEL